MTAYTPPKFGLFSMVMLGVNGVIGSGIFLLPSIPMALLGPSSIFVFPLASLVAMTIALCFAECAGRFETNGGAYLYAREAFGEFVGFEVGLLRLTVHVSTGAAFAVGFVEALGQFIPIVLEEPNHSMAVASFLSLLMISQLLGIHFVKILNNIMTIGKLVPLFLFIVIGIFYLDSSHFTPLIPQKLEFSNIGSATLIIFFAFSGFEAIALAAEDMKNPAKNLPKAILLVLAICSIAYLLIQVIAVGILGSALSESQAPLYDAAIAIGPWIGNLMAIGMLVSIGGVALAASFMTPRTAIALAKDKLLPAKIAELNSKKVPVNAIIICAIITIAVTLTGSFTKLATISVVVRLVQFLPTALAVLVFRRRSKEKSAYQIPFGALIPLLAIIFTLWLVSNASIQELLWGAGALLLGIPLYFSMKYQKTAPVLLKNSSDS